MGADTVVAVSDRRLKSNIKPLGDTLNKNYKVLVSEKQKESDAQMGKDPSSLGWVLRQLRPVSYNFKAGTDSKNVRFGFIADEMQKVLPQVVRELPHQESEPEV